MLTNRYQHDKQQSIYTLYFVWLDLLHRTPRNQGISPLPPAGAAMLNLQMTILSYYFLFLERFVFLCEKNWVIYVYKSVFSWIGDHLVALNRTHAQTSNVFQKNDFHLCVRRNLIIYVYIFIDNISLTKLIYNFPHLFTAKQVCSLKWKKTFFKRKRPWQRAWTNTLPPPPGFS